MSESSQDRFVRAILAIRDGLTTIVEQLNDVLKEYAPPEVKAEKIAELFLKDLADLLTFEETPEWIIIRPREYLGKENFARIAAVVKDQGGEYISAGKQSHFRIPRKAAK